MADIPLYSIPAARAIRETRSPARPTTRAGRLYAQVPLVAGVGLTVLALVVLAEGRALRQGPLLLWAGFVLAGIAQLLGAWLAQRTRDAPVPAARDRLTAAAAGLGLAFAPMSILLGPSLDPEAHALLTAAGMASVLVMGALLIEGPLMALALAAPGLIVGTMTLLLGGLELPAWILLGVVLAGACFAFALMLSVHGLRREPSLQVVPRES